MHLHQRHNYRYNVLFVGVTILPINPGISMLTRMVLRLIKRKSIGKQTCKQGTILYIKVLRQQEYMCTGTPRIQTCVT